MSETISAAERAAAPRLDFGYTPFNASGYDAEAVYADIRPDALVRDDFVVRLYAGATYNLFSDSYYDPILFRIQSSAGTLLAADTVVRDDGFDAIRNFRAPYTGDYYVSAGWNQDTSLRGVYLGLFAELDTASIATAFGIVNRADADPLVDRDFYLTRNPDVQGANLDPVGHYHTNGWREGCDPNAWFSTRDYLDANPDVRAAGLDPLEHFRAFGWREGRDPSLNFDLDRYLATNPDVRASGIDPLSHWLDFGRVDGRPPPVASVGPIPATGFDRQYYLMTNADVAASGLDPYAHYLSSGRREGRDPSAFFDADGYLATYADVRAAGVDPLAHYIAFGWQENRDPSVAFDTSSYLAASRDVAAAGINPLLHFLQFGYVEGRPSFADGTWG